MPRKIVDPGSIDEDLLRDLVGGVPRPDAVPIPSVPLEPADVSSMKTAEAADTSPEVRRRKVTLPDYESTFLKSKTVRHRMTVSISENTKKEIVGGRAIPRNARPVDFRAGRKYPVASSRSLPGRNQPALP